MTRVAGPTLRRLLVRCAVGGLAALAASPASGGAPVTGRAQELHFEPRDLIAETASDYRAYVERLDAKRLIERDSPSARRVERIFRRLLPHAMRLNRESEALRWEVVMVREDAANFALLDGRIFVSARWAQRGRLTDSELALLLAHEMAHVISNHMLERLSALAAKDPENRGSIGDLLRESREQWQMVREIAPLMRAQEIEADRVGAAIAGASGVPLGQAVRLFDHMARAEERSFGMAFVNSHDTALRRKADLLEWAYSMGWPARARR